jgi:hypothetical protein
MHSGDPPSGPVGDHPVDRTSVEADAVGVALAAGVTDLEGDAASTQRERVGELKREIALKRYDVDAGAVADAIVSKLMLVRRGRRALEGAADRTPTGGEPARRAR